MQQKSTECAWLQILGGLCKSNQEQQYNGKKKKGLFNNLVENRTGWHYYCVITLENESFRILSAKLTLLLCLLRCSVAFAEEVTSQCSGPYD